MLWCTDLYLYKSLHPGISQPVSLANAMFLPAVRVALTLHDTLQSSSIAFDLPPLPPIYNLLCIVETSLPPAIVDH